MVSVASQLIEEVTAHARRDSLEDVREMRADGTYFPNNLHTLLLYTSNTISSSYGRRKRFSYMKQTANTVDCLHNSKFGSVFVCVCDWLSSLM